LLGGSLVKKFPKPWYRPGRGVWYVTLGGKQHNLGPTRRKPSSGTSSCSPPAAPPVPGESVLALIDKFLDWCQRERKPRTYEWYRWRLQLFADTIDRSLTVTELKPYHLDEFLAKHSGWTPGMKHGACRAVQRAMLWAEKQGYIERTPVAHYEKPSPGKRKIVIPPAEFTRLLSFVRSPEFEDLLVVTWETGCRPKSRSRCKHGTSISPTPAGSSPRTRARWSNSPASFT